MNLIIETPEDIPKLFAEFWNKRNARGIANLFTENAEFVNVVGLWWHDREAIFKAHDYGLKNIFNNSTLELRKIKTKLLSPSVAVVNVRFKLSNQTSVSDVKNPGLRQNIFTFVLQKSESSWLCVAAQNTDIVPGKETHVVDNEGNIKAVDYRKS
ncbi:SgcJ/EcaC family oxidoreductase [Aquimarina mytili]|uniref:SgcJ/EcaC family oxidoreductase n=1 Tax=Aquimarina mytili TaxID=874423 RepID=A0A937A1Y4_9FLAO|nr:SgcJ/EcaC family oxidoreductase [Aquimarina mytili]MBL0682924.1 SgcJ/EcaC family oxidoreductase [Aquimarina mytili]